MAFVILSTGGLTTSRLHTVRTRTVMLTGGLLLIAVLVGGATLGYRAGQASVPETTIVEMPSTTAPLTLDQPEGRALIDRVGELSGRLIRLETEAVTLARRVGVLKEFEAQAGKPQAAPQVKEDASAPSGGPLLPPLGDMLSDNLSGVMHALTAGDDDYGTGLAALERQLDRLDEAFALVERAATERNLQNMAFPSRLPVEGRPITSGFGNRLDPFTRRLARHTGVDFPAPRGTPIVASAGGRVERAGYSPDYGYTVEIDHGNGLVTRYAHASRLLVREGDLVMPRQPIALVGSTGRSTGPHLHFEIMRNGQFADPRHYLVRAERG